jgi:hypothetical protein
LRWKTGCTSVVPPKAQPVFHRYILGKEFQTYPSGYVCFFKRVATLIASNKIFEYFENISLENARVNLTDPLIFLCGGITDVKIQPPKSMRGYLLAHLAKINSGLIDSITLAETFKDWIHDGIYNDLMTFEDDIAHFSTLIVIILESPGALTELGIFARNKMINKKILVFINEKYYEEDSFIKLGPVRHLEKINNRSVASYPWPMTLLDVSSDILSNMHDDISSAISSQKKSEIFNKNNDGHLALYIYQVILIHAALLTI